MVKVSFILPAYKRRFLKEAIASILAQTYRDFELVVVDDCSPENLKEVVDEFQDERLTYHRNEQNIGGMDLVAAWNHAMEFATGEWCVLASDDDVYLPRFLEEMMMLHHKYPSVDLIQAREAVIDSKGKWVDIAHQRVELYSQIQMLYTRGVMRYRQYASEFLFRLRAFKAIGGFVRFPDAIYSDDATWFKLAANYVACTAEPLMLFRESGINLSIRLDNIDRKVDACVRYSLWIENEIRKLTPCNKEEQFLLGYLSSGVSQSIFGVERYLLKRAISINQWLKLIKLINVGTSRRCILWIDRYPFMRWLPFKRFW